MGLLTDWTKQPPQLRLGLVSSAGFVASVLSAEVLGVFGSNPGTELIAPIGTAASLGVVAAYCWFANGSLSRATEPSTVLRRVRNGLAGVLAVMLAVSIAAAFPGGRVGLSTDLHLPLAIVVALIAVPFAGVAIVFVRREQGFFTSRAEAATALGDATTTASIHQPLEGARTAHGLVASIAVPVTLMWFAAGASPYFLPLAGLVLIPSVATWAYAALRLSHLDRRPLPKPSPDWPPRHFRAARFVAVAVLALVPIGVLWWVLLSVDNWGGNGVDIAGETSRADLVLVVFAIAGLTAAVAYPFFAIAEALRTPMKEPADEEGNAGAGDELEPLPEWTLEARSRRAPGRDPL